MGMRWLSSLCPVVVFEILKAFSKVLSQSVEYKLKSKVAYLGGRWLYGVESELGLWRSAGFH